jgi:hypothetical protein
VKILKLILILVVVAAVIGGGIWYFTSRSGPAIRYRFVSVARGDGSYHGITQAACVLDILNVTTDSFFYYTRR